MTTWGRVPDMVLDLAKKDILGPHAGHGFGHGQKGQLGPRGPQLVSGMANNGARRLVKLQSPKTQGQRGRQTHDALANGWANGTNKPWLAV